MSHTEPQVAPNPRPPFQSGGTAPATAPPGAAAPLWPAPTGGQGASLSAGPSSGTRPAGAAGSPYAGMYDDGQAPGPFRAPWANAFLSGITDEKSGADYAARHINGQNTGVAMYEGTSTSGVGDPNVRGAEFNSTDPAVREAANGRNTNDLLYDMTAVTQFARLGDNVTVDRNGQLVMNHDALNDPVQTGGANGEQYQSAEAIGRMGGDAAIQSNPALARLMQQGGDPTQNPALAEQFISLTGHSGGGQSSFYSAIDLYQRGFRNVSLVGYDMAMSPHQREVLEQLGIPVTNLTGHSGDQNNYVNSPGGEGIRLGMGGDQNYFDASIDRGGDPLDAVGQHDVVSSDKVTTMLRYSTWLDSVGRHQQWNGDNYAQFLAATGGSGNQIGSGNDQHTSENPLAGSFVNHHQRDNDLYLQTPEWNGQDLINGISGVPFLGSWLGNQASQLGNQMTPDFESTQLPRLDMALDANLTTQGSADLRQGAAQGSASLEGSTIDVLGAHVTAPEWVRASGGVNLSQGTGNVNVGGQNGVGADMNLAQGNLDLNVLGNKIDVDQGVRDLGRGINNGINNGIQGLGNFFGFGR